MTNPLKLTSLEEREAALLALQRVAKERALVATTREADVLLQENALHERDAALQFHANQDLLIKVQLREANEKLVVAIIRAQAMKDAAELGAAQVSHMASHDSLTGLPNRALLTDRLAQAISLARRHGTRVALMYLDIDHFKNINDSLGHAVGDTLLQAAAARLMECVRGSDTVCRQGGDEFVVLLPQVDTVRDATLIAEKLVAAMAQPFAIDGRHLHVTLSIGVSVYPDDGSDGDVLLRNADTAMYQAKKSGRNQYRAFSAEMNTRAIARLSVEAALRRSLDARALVLHYQPTLNLGTGNITGAEALVRLEQPDGQLMYPTQFIGVAEDCGLIHPVGKWVLGEACRQAVAWQQAGVDFGQIAVNVSAAELHSGDFLAHVRATLRDTGLDPRHLEFELTESGLMQDTQRTTGVLLALKDLGIHIAIDDFGTGYSSLSYLRRFPIDTLKIDQSFVKDIQGEAGEGILVSTIIAMARSLKLRVVAEGIETSQQLAYLQTEGCAEGQGYHFSHPVGAGQFAALLGNGHTPLFPPLAS